MSGVTLRNVRKTYPDGTQVLHGIDLEIKDGEFTVFVGPSGCGKTTLLRMIAGLEDITDGEIRIGDTLINEIPPAERGVAMVFQSYALYPHMTVGENMGFALKLAGKSKREIQERSRPRRRNSPDHSLARTQTQGTFRRSAPTCGHWPRDRPYAESVPV